MAEEQIEETIAAEAPVPEKARKGGIMKRLLAGLLIAGLAATGGYYFYGKKLLAHYIPSQGAPTKQEKVEVGPILSLEPFIINVSGNSSRFVKISVALELRNAKAAEHGKQMTPVVRDIMLSVFGTKTPEAFMDVRERESMKKELFDGINRLFSDGGLKAVYVTDIIMQ